MLASGITEKCEERDEQKRSAKQSGNMLMVLKKSKGWTQEPLREYQEEEEDFFNILEDQRQHWNHVESPRKNRTVG